MNQIKNLKKAVILSKKEQSSINGGGIIFPIGCRTRRDCFNVTGEFDWACVNRTCIPL
ncbi:hypothetical protein [Aquimarina algicola]|uniref:hypothetical protein n=1 Tax=Aquimarina algicola TaxID=2589995 RepID=UPI001CF5BF3B|nr:hypothetical protein [Aquimarina algicola]